jgi:hypothetical protein
MRAALVCALLVLLSACGSPDLLHSDTDLIAGHEGKGRSLRSGIWLSPSGGCEVEVSLPVTAWPDCAEWSVVTADQLFPHLGPSSDFEVHGGMYAFLDGNPGVLQTGQRAEFTYSFARALKVDQDNWIVALRIWPVVCGAPFTGMEAENTVADGDVPDVQGPAQSEAPPEPERQYPEPTIPGAFRIGRDCYASGPETLARAQAMARWEQLLEPANFTWIRDAD